MDSLTIHVTPERRQHLTGEDLQRMLANEWVLITFWSHKLKALVASEAEANEFLDPHGEDDQLVMLNAHRERFLVPVESIGRVEIL